MKTYTLYQHINKINGKSYVGITSKNVNERWGKGSGYAKHSRFRLAIEKYGWDSFEHIILKTGLTRDEASDLEKSLIKELQLTNSEYGYNAMAGGSPNEHSDATRTKISESLKGNALRPKKAVNQYDIRTGELIKSHPSLLCASKSVGASVGNICLACQRKRGIVKGYVWLYAEENVEKINPDEYDTTEFTDGKRVMQFSIYGEYIYTYKNLKRASEITGISYASISAACNKRHRTAGNYCWEFADETL